VVPRVLPPVGTRGRPLRVFLASPALGKSQLEAGEVVEKARHDGNDVEEWGPEHRVSAQVIVMSIAQCT